MEMNLQMHDELKQLSKLSAQLKYVENLWAERFSNRRVAEQIGAEPHVLRRYDGLIEDAANKIAQIKNMIVGHVHALAALTDAQLNADGGDAT